MHICVCYAYDMHMCVCYYVFKQLVHLVMYNYQRCFVPKFITIILIGLKSGVMMHVFMCVVSKSCTWAFTLGTASLVLVAFMGARRSFLGPEELYTLSSSVGTLLHLPFIH